MESSALKNRLIKNHKKLKSYLEKNEIEAFRIYAKDIPEWPFLIDIYGKEAVIYEQGKKLGDEESNLRTAHLDDVKKSLEDVFKISEKHQHFKIREKQKGTEQYRPLDPSSKDFFTIQEPPFKFWVNLERYLDTGLFLDHRPLRQFLFKNSSGKKVLNLFCYTGSLSVASAMGGATVTSVDMSRTYLNWAEENFILNGISLDKHRFIQADVLKQLKVMEEQNEKFDLIILDPPSFSNSKRMEDILDVERDHPLLIRDCFKLLNPEGTLFFSTNKRKFELHSLVTSHHKVTEISQWTIPVDFAHSNIHRAFKLEHIRKT